MARTRNWIPLLMGAICVPALVPWILYQLYRYQEQRRLYRLEQLRGKVVLITGASSALGQALTQVFHKAGCKLILAAQNEEDLNRIGQDLAIGEMEEEIQVICLDPNELTSMSEMVVAALGGRSVDILLNTSGAGFWAEASTTDLALDIKLLVLNYLAHLALTKALLPSMLRANSGSIVAVTGIQGKIATPFRSSYAAAEHALHAFFECLRSELSDTNIHICLVSLDSAHPELCTGSSGSPPSREVVGPQEAAQQVLKAVVNRDQEVIMASLTARLIMGVRTLVPALFCHLMANRARRLRIKSESSLHPTSILH